MKEKPGEPRLQLYILVDDPKPMYAQLESQLRDLILAGHLKPETRLPTAGALARDLAENLRRYGWREARRTVMRQGPVDREWINHRGRPPVRLTRKGVEVKLADGVEALDWKRMQGQIRARRS